MRFVYFVILVAILAVCFFVGYQTGRQGEPGNTEQPVETPTPTEITTKPQETPAETDNAEAPERPTRSPEELAEHEMKARAARGVVDLTDQQGRTITALILDAQPDALRVRRQVDFTVVEIPHEMLGEEDREFAKFLWEQERSDAPESTNSSEAAESTNNDLEIPTNLFDEKFGQ